MVSVTVIFGKRILELRSEKIQFAEIAERVRNAREEKGAIEYEFKEGKIMLPEYKELWEENGDLAGWISIDGTEIDYPVMETLEEPEYYLHRNFYKEESYAGTPFMNRSKLDGGKGTCVFLYGHNMRNGTMFAELLKYRKRDYWEKHREIAFDSLWERKRYEVISAFYGGEEDWTEPDGVFYQIVQKKDCDWEKFFERIEKLGFYETNRVDNTERSVLVLVTCSYQKDDGRMVIVAIEM